MKQLHSTLLNGEHKYNNSMYIKIYITNTLHLHHLDLHEEFAKPLYKMTPIRATTVWYTRVFGTQISR